MTPPLQLKRFFLFVIVALQVARKIASCNMTLMYILFTVVMRLATQAIVPHVTSMTLPLGPMTHMETSTFFDVVFPAPVEREGRNP